MRNFLSELFGPHFAFQRGEAGWTLKDVEPADGQVNPAFQETASRWGRSTSPPEYAENSSCWAAELWRGEGSGGMTRPSASLSSVLQKPFCPSESCLPARAHSPRCRCAPGLGGPQPPHFQLTCLFQSRLFVLTSLLCAGSIFLPPSLKFQ